MNKDLATAFARETADTIRRVQAPLLERVGKLEAALATQASDNAATIAKIKTVAETEFDDLLAVVEEKIAAAVEKAVAVIPVVAGAPGDSFVYRGVFDAGECYKANDWVTHDGTLWAALAASKGYAPGSDEGAASWKMAMKRPRDGVNGVGLNWRGAHSAGELYRINDVVRDGNRVFICRKSTSTNPPIPGGAPAVEWALMLES